MQKAERNWENEAWWDFALNSEIEMHNNAPINIIPIAR